MSEEWVPESDQLLLLILIDQSAGRFWFSQHRRAMPSKDFNLQELSVKTMCEDDLRPIHDYDYDNVNHSCNH